MGDQRDQPRFACGQELIELDKVARRAHRTLGGPIADGATDRSVLPLQMSSDKASEPIRRDKAVLVSNGNERCPRTHDPDTPRYGLRGLPFQRDDLYSRE